MATYGLFEPGGVALFVRLEPPPDTDGGIAIGVRVHGEATLGERLLATTLAWNEAGRPDVERLRIRAYATEAPCEPQPQEIVLTRPCTRLVLEWAPAQPRVVPSPPRGQRGSSGPNFGPR